MNLCLHGMIFVGDRADINWDEWNAGRSADPPPSVWAEHHWIQTQHRPTGGRPSAHSGSTYIWQQIHCLHYGGMYMQIHQFMMLALFGNSKCLGQVCTIPTCCSQLVLSMFSYSHLLFIWQFFHCLFLLYSTFVLVGSNSLLQLPAPLTRSRTRFWLVMLKASARSSFMSTARPSITLTRSGTHLHV